MSLTKAEQGLVKTISSYSTFERISSKMAREFGRMKKGKEESYALLLLPIESNLLKANRKCGINNGRRAIEAIRLCLFKIEGYVNGWEYDFGQYLTSDNRDYLDAVLYAVDPGFNDELSAVVSQWYDMSRADDLREYFSLPVKCLLRIEDSIQMWTKEGGASGYFDFLESTFGVAVGDDKMDFTVARRTP